MRIGVGKLKRFALWRGSWKVGLVEVLMFNPEVLLLLLLVLVLFGEAIAA